MAISQSVLLRYAQNHIISEAVESLSKRASAKIKAFLCHSHFDNELAIGLQKLLKAEEVDIYIDWQDTTMPTETNIETADRLKRKIENSDIFLFLATENSVSSRWCPWEIGVADGIKKKIYIIPTQDSNSDYGSEYLQLYPRVDIGTNRLTGQCVYAIFKPNTDAGQCVSTEAFL